MDRNPRHAQFAIPAFLVLLLPYFWLVHRFWFVCDDAWITFRFSRNLAMGHGARYNLGDHVPVEGYSNFLWMLIAAGAELVGINPGTLMPVLSVLCGTALLGLLYRTLLVHGRVSLPIAWLSTLLVGIFPPFAVWSTSGLATMPQALFMFAAWALLTLEDDRRSWWLAGSSALLLALVRTEGVAWAVVIAILAAGHRRYEKREVVEPLKAYVLVLLGGYVPYFIARYSYYQSLVANTASAKVHMQLSTLVRGVDYILLYLTTLLSPLALFFTLPLGWTSRRRAMAMTAGLMAIGVPAYGITVSGDYMTWFRILTPGVPFMAVSIALAAEAVAERTKVPAASAGAVALLALLGFLPSQDIHLVPQSVRTEFQVRDKLGHFRTENDQWQAMVNHVENWTEKGKALGDFAKPGDRYIAAAIGALGYNSNIFIYDRNGLVNREVAAKPWNGKLRSPGHDKVVDPSFFYDKNPDIMDSKLVSGPSVGQRIDIALIEMDARKLRDRNYYPVLVELDNGGKRKTRKYLVPLVRAESTEEALEGWEAYRVARTKVGK